MIKGKTRRKRKTIERFMEKVLIPDKGCWIWNAFKNKEGYGLFRYGNKIALAHRISYEIFDRKPASSELVCHHCDNPSCVNPKHLFLGTDRTNSDDKIRKKRHLFGSKFPQSKIDESTAIKIRKEYFVKNMTTRELSKKYGIAHSGISNVITYKNWRHI
jgi:hypothetical protein